MSTTAVQGTTRSFGAHATSAITRWLQSSTTIGMFRKDPLLLSAFLILCVSITWPIFVTPVMPFVDMGVNIGAAGLLKDAAFGHGVVAEYYSVNPKLLPYWTVYLLMSTLSGALGPFWAVRITVMLAVTLLPLATMRLMRAFGRDPRLGLWAFSLSWDRNLYWGWITFSIGMAVALWTLAKLFEIRSPRDAFKLLPVSLLLALTHVHAVVLTLVAGALITLIKRPLLKAMLLNFIAVSGCAVVFGPWALSKLGLGVAGPHIPLSTVDHSFEARLGGLYGFTLDVIVGINGEPAPAILKIAFGTLLVGPVIFLLVAPRPVTQAQRAASAVFLLAVAGLYAFVPFQVSGPIQHYWTYPRFGTYLLVALLLLPRPRLDGWRALWLTPGLVAAVLTHRAVQRQFAAYSTYVKPYLEIVQALPRNKLLFPLDLDDFRFKETHEGVLGQIHGYAAAAKSNFDPHLFDDPNNPLLYEHSKMPPIVNWLAPTTFSMEAQGKFYDYIVIHPIDLDPFDRHPEWRSLVRLTKQAGAWRLYEVKGGRAPAPAP